MRDEEMRDEEMRDEEMRDLKKFVQFVAKNH